MDNEDTRTRVDFGDDVDAFALLERVEKRFGCRPPDEDRCRRYDEMMRSRKVDKSPWLKPVKKRQR